MSKSTLTAPTSSGTHSLALVLFQLDGSLGSTHTVAICVQGTKVCSLIHVCKKKKKMD